MKKVDLLQLIIIGGIICNISEITCCKYIQQYILTKNADANDRLKRGLIFLIPYEENDKTHNSNESSQEKILIDDTKTTMEKLNKTKRDQPLKIYLHFNNKFEKNNITDNTENLNTKNDTSYINMKFISDQKEIKKNLINTKNIAKNEKNFENKNLTIITMNAKANRSRRMSQKKYMCFCKQANCKGRQCLHEQIQHHYPWKKNYFPNVKEYTEDEYDEDLSTEKSNDANVNAYKSIKTYVKSNTATPIEPTKFNIPFANNINFDQRVMVGNENPLINQRQNHPNIYYSNPQMKIQQNEAFPISKYNLHNISPNRITYSELTPIEQNHATITNSQLKETNNFTPSIFGKKFHNIDDCIKLYGHTVCIILRNTSTDNIEATDLLNNVPIKSYLNDKNNKLDEYYTNTKTEFKFSHSNEFDEVIKSNSNLTFNNYLTKEIIKNKTKNNVQNIKKTNTYPMNENNHASMQNANLDDSLPIVNNTNLSNNYSKPIFSINNVHSLMPLKSNNTQQRITTRSPALKNLQNTINGGATVTDNSTFLNESNKKSSNEKQTQLKFSNNIQSLNNNENIESKTNNDENRGELPQIIFSTNDTKTLLKEIEQDNLITDNISNLLKKNNSKNYERNALIKLNINPDRKNTESTQKPFYGQTRRSTTEHDNKLKQLENKLNFPGINMINVDKKKNFENIETLVQSVDDKPYIIYEKTSNNNSINNNNNHNNNTILNSDIPSFSSNEDVTQAYNNINDNMMLTMNPNAKTEVNDNLNNNQENTNISIKDNINEILFKNVIKKVINNFVPGKAQDLIANYGKDNSLKFSDTNMEDVFPEILNTPDLKNLFFTPEVEDMIADTAKNFIFQITGSPPNNVQVIKNMLHNIVDKIFLSDPTVASVIVNKDGQWVTETVTLLDKSKDLVSSNNVPKQIFNKIQNIINQAAIGEKNARDPVIKNLIIKTVKYSLDKETGAVDESTIRQAFELLLNKNLNSSNLMTSEKTPNIKTNNSLTLKDTTSLNNTDYKVQSTNTIKQDSLHNRRLIELPKSLFKKQNNENMEFKEKRRISQEKLNNLQFRKIKPEDQFINDTNKKIQKYQFNSQRAKEDSEILKKFSEKPINYTFLNEKIKNKYIGNIELSEPDASIERKPIRYFTPSDRILEYIKNHQNLDNLNLKAVAKIIGNDDKYNIDKVTRTGFTEIPTVIINYNISEIGEHPINTLDYELSILQSNPYELENATEKENFKRQPINTNNYKNEQQTFHRNPVKFTINNHRSNLLIEINNSSVSENEMSKNNESKTNIKIENNVDINQTTNGLNHNQILDVSKNKLLQPLPTNKYNVNSSLSQNLKYLGKLVPENSNQMSEIKNLDKSQESKLIYIGDGVKLPIIIKKLEDGTFALMLSDAICKQCIYENCSCYLPNTNEPVLNVRERRSDEAIPLFNFLDQQGKVKESTIDWLTETLTKAHNLIPNLITNNKLEMKSKELKDANEEINPKTNLNQSQIDFSVIGDLIASKNKEFYTINEFINKQVNPNNILNRNIAKTFTSTFKKPINNNVLFTENNTQIINHDHPQEKLENDINQIKLNDKVGQKLNKITFQNIRIGKKSNKNNIFDTEFDYEMSNPLFSELSQPQNNINSVNGGPPYKYQRYANEDLIVSRRTKTLNNVLHFMKNLLINTTDDY